MILTHPGSFPSSKILRDAIIKELGWKKKRLLVTKNARKIGKLHLRYGNSDRVPVSDTNIINYKSFINFCSNKQKAANAVNKHLPESAPKFSRISRNLPTKEDFPFLIRETLTGSGSDGILIFQEFEGFLEALSRGTVSYSHYWTPYFSLTEEYRVHVLGGKIAKIFRKQLEEPKKQEDIFIRNNDNSHFYRIKQTNTPESVLKIVKTFDEVFSSNWRPHAYFTALDVGVDTEKDRAYFIEANTAPGLNESTANLYAKYIIDTCQVFIETAKELEIVKELRKKTDNMGVNWILTYND